ncbi:MAG TPA: tripartite tricarboxylate transporter substrate-binding protein [Alphaproteobacteria bacterium]|nr:tripartite tricarboxylate transporter substrate-binding protein [Alphaproteobacteria bacterium]
MFKRFMGIALGAAALFAQPAMAQTNAIADFYAKKNVDIYVGGAGALELHSRMIAPYLTKHLPGNPTMVVRAMPGAGGAKAANFLYSVAPKDGTAIAQLLPYIAISQAVGSREVQYDSAKYNYIGSIAPINSVLATWNASTEPKAKTFEDMKKTEIALGSTGRSSITFIGPTIANNYLGTKFKIVSGYPGTAPIMLAMERGELNGRVADYEGILGPHPDWIEKKLVTLHFHTGLEPDPSLPGVPRLIDLAQTAEQKDFMQFVASGSALGRVFVAPPGVPTARVAALQKAFMDAVNDPEYRKFLEDRRLLVNPKSGPELLKIVESVLNASPATIEKAKELFVGDE